MTRGILGLVAGAAVTIVSVAAVPGSEARGQEAFDKRCTGCHAMDRIKVGPPLGGVYGRRAGRNAQFPYSEALRNANVTWDAATLERWLEDTDSVVPGNEMAFRLQNPEERRAIVKYLEQAATQTH